MTLTLFETFVQHCLRLNLTAERQSVARFSEANLRSYQSFIADKIIELPGVLLAVPMGMGKTAATLTGVSKLLEQNPKQRCLVVGPLEVARSTWPDEIPNWQHLEHLTFSVACGDADERAAAVAKDTQITIINRENLPWLWQHVGGEQGWRWQILVYDESSRLKGFTFRTPAMKRDPKTGEKVLRKPNLTEFGVLSQARKKIERVIELSGTPSPNGVFDLGGQIYLIDKGERLGRNKTTFTANFFDTNPFSHQITPKPGANEQIMEKIKDVMVGLRASDYIDLPPQVFNPIYVNLSPTHMKQYKEFEKTLVAELYDVEAVSRGVLTNKLLQFSNGGLYKTDETVYPPKRETIPIHDTKIKALESVIEEASGNNVLIAYSFKFDKERIKKRFPKAVFFDEEPDFVRKWNNNQINIGVAHPACLHTDTEVLTERRGWIRIVDVTIDDRVFDGTEFVSHQGCQYSGFKKVINVFGVKMTPDHRILVNGEWKKAEDVRACNSIKAEARYTYKGNDRGISQMLAVPHGARHVGTELPQAQSEEKHALRPLHKTNVPQSDQYAHLSNMERHKSSDAGQKRSELRRTWYRNVGVVDGILKFLCRHGANLSRWFYNREGGCERRLLQRELHMGSPVYTAVEQTEQSRFQLHGSRDALGRGLQFDRCEQNKTHKSPGKGHDIGRGTGVSEKLYIRQGSDRQRCSVGANSSTICETTREVADVFDLVNCGPRHRFLIRNSDGDHFISHNSIGHGLNLQHGGYIQCWYGLTWSLELWDQFNRRLARPGQKNHSVFIHVIMARGTMDEVQYETLRTKGVTQDAIMDAVRVRLKA